ncbi:MFS transporter [Chitinophaga filiformis]|uniref:MFS transporter n=1 Tax=Chitinophaga filiformis TaxID=104663 RepID=A0ABY4HXS3_CHIFI|nr:MFS transporter [Chitinophaga filiformis]UPK68352.1 MFS transporter [Chitinophaga filiformis]
MKYRNYRLWIIIGIVLLNSIGLSIVLPLLPFLVGNYLPPQQVVVGMSLLMSVFATCTFFAAPAFGALSDRYGRKYILIISLLGSVAGYVLFGIGGALWMLFLGRIIDGLTAGNISILFAYIADTTQPDERAKWFGYIGAVMGIGKIGGPALGGLLGSISIGLPFFVTAGLILLSALATYFLLPESLNIERRTKHLSLNSFNTFSHFRDVFSLNGVLLLLITGILFYISLSIFQFNLTVFLKDVYQWTPAWIGAILTLVGICEIVVRAVLLPLLLKHFNEKSIGVVGLVTVTVGLSSILVSIYIHSAVIIAIAIICIICGEGLFDPTYNGKLSQLVEENNQGKLQGVNQSLQALNNMLVPLCAAAIYFYSPGMLYVTATVIMLAAIIVYMKHRS